MAEAAVVRGQATRQRLLEAAVQLVGEAGWNAVTTRMVAERAQVAPGVVHYHFSSVTDLLIAASIGFARELAGRLGEQLAEQPDLDGGIDWLLAETAGYSGHDPASLVMLEMYLASTRIPHLRDELAALVLDLRRTLAGWLAERGCTADVEAVAALLGAVIDGLVLHHHLDPGLDVAALAGPVRAMLRREQK
ncbi:TetR/AcrR family transcriptional regulator [Nonomuraea basaltis]|uniref:TetR/AcrR family transcriptional regulator n=1 Tax=Nonomuraea basaltis TaxID=2495887 RepID=UPI00110C4EC3|nr:TetR family transcriptional regulator [Nonomuraea basaltis]TMR93541.1 TetR family transcriptional regulator [Nonomuraea basaltis]